MMIDPFLKKIKISRILNSKAPDFGKKMAESMEKNPSNFEDLSSVQAVLVGALAPGVNAPTWSTLKLVFVMLGISLILMLVLGFTYSESSLVLHAGFLLFLALTLFFLLSSFLEQTGLVSVEHQMQEIGLAPKDSKTNPKTE